MAVSPPTPAMYRQFALDQALSQARAKPAKMLAAVRRRMPGAANETTVQAAFTFVTVDAATCAVKIIHGVDEVDAPHPDLHITQTFVSPPGFRPRAAAAMPHGRVMVVVGTGTACQNVLVAELRDCRTGRFQGAPPPLVTDELRPCGAFSQMLWHLRARDDRVGTMGFTAACVTASRFLVLADVATSSCVALPVPAAYLCSAAAQ